MKVLLRCFLLMAVFVSAFAIVPKSAQAQLLITPLQVVIEGRERSKQIILVNTGKQTNTYRIEWQQLKQVDGPGGYLVDEEYAEGDNRFLQNFAVFSPRQITIAPGEKQTVRVAVRRPAELAEGEYKSHLKFHIISAPVGGGKNGEFNPNLNEGEINIGIQVRASYSIPIIYRVGSHDVDVEIGQPSFNISERTGFMNVQIPLFRDGLHGVIGEVQVHHTPNNGEKFYVGALGNANLFPEISQRNVNISSQIQGLAPGTMSVVFKKIEGDMGEHVVLSEKTFQINN